MDDRGVTTSILAAALLLGAPLAAQTSLSADATATVVVAPFLSLAKTQDINFGTHFATDGDVSTSPSNHARWSGSTDVGNHVSVAFTSLPGALNKVGGLGSVPVTYGTRAGRSRTTSSSARSTPRRASPTSARSRRPARSR